MPSYNVQLVTDTNHGLVVKVEATTDAIDYRQLEPTLNRCQQTLGCRPQQIVADGDYTNHASVQAAAAAEWDFYGSWQESWKPVERDAQGRSAAFLGGAFPYDAEQDCFTCPAGQTALRWRKMTSQKRFNNGRPLSLRIPARPHRQVRMESSSRLRRKSATCCTNAMISGCGLSSRDESCGWNNVAM